MCLDDVAEVREVVSTKATAGILKNLIRSKKQDLINNFMDQLKYFKDSPSFTHRQTFVGMMQSIFVDFFIPEEDQP